MQRENQRVAISKRLLQEALIRLLHKKELDRISVTELCREAGINRATFYRHYEIPRDVLVECERELFSETLMYRSLPQSAGEIRQYIHSICSYMDQHAELMRLMIGSHLDEELIERMREITTACIRHMMAEGKLPRPLDEEEIKFITDYGAGGGYYVLRQWCMGRIRKSAGEIAALICDLLFSTDWEALCAQLH